MKNLYLVKILNSNYCKLVFLLSFIGSYYLIPENVFHSGNRLIAMIFMLVFALSVTCIVRNTKERVLLAKTYKTSILSIIATAIGISALQVCGMGSMCVMGAGVGILSIFLPGFALNYLEAHGVIILYFSIFLQLVALYFLKCFAFQEEKKKCDDKKINNKNYDTQ